MIQEYKTTLNYIKTVARDTLVFRFDKPENWNFVAGQFISLKFTDTAYRAYSIASAPTEKNIELVVRLIAGGLGSEALKKAVIGQEFSFRGPFGMMKLSTTKSVSQVFCATGTGIAPFRSMILSEIETKSPRPMFLLYGGKDAEDLAYLKELASNTHIKVFFGLSREGDSSKLESLNINNHKAEKCRITNFLLREDFGNLAEYYICGNGDMVQSVRECLLEKNVDPKQIHQERFN